eukprot:4646366-Lingulodinium_polyedra.AAC.1
MRNAPRFVQQASGSLIVAPDPLLRGPNDPILRDVNAKTLERGSGIRLLMHDKAGRAEQLIAA